MIYASKFLIKHRNLSSTLINEIKEVKTLIINILEDNESLIGDEALRNMFYLLILKLLEP